MFGLFDIVVQEYNYLADVVCGLFDIVVQEYDYFVDVVFVLFHNDKYDITQNTGTIPLEQKQHYDKYDIAQNTGTIHVERNNLMTNII